MSKVTLLAASLLSLVFLLTSPGHCQEVTRSDDHLPAGIRELNALREYPDAEYQCGCDNSDGDGLDSEEELMQSLADAQTLNGWVTSAPLFPESSHLAVEKVPGPIEIFMANGVVVLLPPGVYFRLEDGSIWRVMDEDVWATGDWLPHDSLHIHALTIWFHTPYRYSFMNLNTGVSVRVRCEAGPKRSWAQRTWVVDRNLFTRDLLLDNGIYGQTCWRVSSRDRVEFASWLPNDSIVIGVNDGYLGYKRPNVLINMTTGGWVRASWIP